MNKRKNPREELGEATAWKKRAILDLPRCDLAIDGNRLLGEDHAKSKRKSIHEKGDTGEGHCASSRVILRSMGTGIRRKVCFMNTHDIAIRLRKSENETAES